MTPTHINSEQDALPYGLAWMILPAAEPVKVFRDRAWQEVLPADLREGDQFPPNTTEGQCLLEVAAVPSQIPRYSDTGLPLVKLVVDRRPL